MSMTGFLKGKDEVVPECTIKAQGEMSVWPCPFRTSVLDGGERPVSRPGHFVL
jgi:hypothetical protein